MGPREAEVDVVIVGGGPGGLSAALVLGRARKKVVLFDAGPRRNERAAHLHGFVTRDGTPPLEFRAIAREQLAPYDVTFRAERVIAIDRLGETFRVTSEGGVLTARRIVLALGVTDLPLDIPGMREAWGHSVVQCPHCHGWEHRDQRWGVLIPSVPFADFAVMLTGWTPSVVAFTHGAFELPPDVRGRLQAAEVQLEERPLKRLVVGPGGVLRGAELEEGRVIPLDILFTKPPQRLPPLVHALGLALDDAGYVRVSAQQETSVPGIFAVGDVTTPGQAAIVAAHGGAVAGWMLVHNLNIHPPRHAA